ncbi:MAG: hypothetical protein ACI9G1_004861, partial [Pirellulaceae bacterium]
TTAQMTVHEDAPRRLRRRDESVATFMFEPFGAEASQSRSSQYIGGKCGGIEAESPVSIFVRYSICAATTCQHKMLMLAPHAVRAANYVEFAD